MDPEATWQALQRLDFSQPHPLGLPAHFSHPVRELGRGSFGRVYLCFCKAPPAPAPQSDLPEGEQHGERAMSLDGALPAYTQPNVLPNGLDVSQLQWHDLPWVAVKVYKPLGQCDSRSLEYLKREVVNQRCLEHQHVISFKEVGMAHACMHVCMQAYAPRCDMGECDVAECHRYKSSAICRRSHHPGRRPTTPRAHAAGGSHHAFTLCA